MAFDVQTTSDFEQEAAAILAWLINQHAGETCLRWFLRMDEAIASLSELPQRCRLAPENRSFPFEVRELHYGHRPHIYRLLFTIEGGTVYVLHVHHARRQPLTPS